MLYFTDTIGFDGCNGIAVGINCSEYSYQNTKGYDTYVSQTIHTFTNRLHLFKYLKENM